MKIPPIQSQSAITAYNKARAYAAPVSGVSLKPDAVEISADAAHFGDTFRAVMQAVKEGTPATRARQEAAAEQVEKGAYEVSSDKVARAILQGLKLDTEA